MKRWIAATLVLVLLLPGAHAQTGRVKTTGQPQPHGSSRTKRGQADKSNTYNSSDQGADTGTAGHARQTPAKKPARKK